LRRDGNAVDPLRLKVPADSQFAEIPLEPDTTYLFNPGSVGQPRDGDPRAGFAIADLGGKKVEFWRVKYDIAAVQDRMFRAGLPEPLIMRIAFGR
jgi:diadenosine tetraphosphatase ApaH/serine/threonine PP2A family protein phosphatase